MSLRPRRRQGTSPLDLMEEAVALLRRAPASAHLAYYFGAIPFWLGLLYFISDMSRDAYAANRIADSSLVVTVLYVWKKCWQTVAAGILRATLSGYSAGAWSAGRIWRMILTQAALQPTGLIVRPVAAVLTLPFFWVAAFYQNVTLLGDGTEHEQSVMSRAMAQAKLWPGQGHAAVGIVFLFSVFVWLNVCGALAAGPFLLKALLGIETIFSRSAAAYLNTTFFTVTFALTSLAVDPLRKAVFVVRCFRGESLQSGEDLAAELRAIRNRAASSLSLAAAVVLALLPVSAVAQSAPRPRADAAELDRRIGEVLERREYTWRAPRQKLPAAEKKGWLTSWLEGAGKSVQNFVSAAFRQIGRAVRWVGRLFNPPKISTPSGPDIDWVGLGKAFLVLLGAGIVGVLGWVLFKAWRGRKVTIATAVEAQTVPDLRSEDIVADQLPEDRWLQLARDHAARGELSLALRAAWLAGLAHLGEREFIVIARHKSNRDYERELRRRARDRGELMAAFDDNLGAFEKSWYGKHAVTPDAYARFELNHERIRQS